MTENHKGRGRWPRGAAVAWDITYDCAVEVCGIGRGYVQIIDGGIIFGRPVDQMAWLTPRARVMLRLARRAAREEMTS